MKPLSSFISLLPALILIGCQTTPPPRDYSGKPATHIAVTVTCSDPTMRFTGTIVSDGRTKQLAGTGTASYDVTGHEFVCSFRKTGAGGQISISISESGKNLGSAYNDKQFGGVSAEVRRTAPEAINIFSTF